MPTLLRIDASPRGQAAHSVRLADEVTAKLVASEPDLAVIHRRLQSSAPVIDAVYADAMIAHRTQDASQGIAALAASEELIGELEHSDRLLISTPMHNYTVPAALKIWIDQVVRIGRTFQSTPDGKVGSLRDRPTLVVVSSGGWFTGKRARQPDHLSSYLRDILTTLGIRDVTFIALEGLSRGPDAVEEAYRAARAQIARVS